MFRLFSASGPAGGSKLYQQPLTAVKLRKIVSVQNNTRSSARLALCSHEDVPKQSRQRRPHVRQQKVGLPADIPSEADHEELPGRLQHQPGRPVPHYQGDSKLQFDAKSPGSPSGANSSAAHPPAADANSG